MTIRFIAAAVAYEIFIMNPEEYNVWRARLNLSRFSKKTINKFSPQLFWNFPKVQLRRLGCGRDIKYINWCIILNANIIYGKENTFFPVFVYLEEEKKTKISVAQRCFCLPFLDENMSNLCLIGFFSRETVGGEEQFINVYTIEMHALLYF